MCVKVYGRQPVMGSKGFVAPVLELDSSFLGGGHGPRDKLPSPGKGGLSEIGDRQHWTQRREWDRLLGCDGDGSWAGEE